MDIEKYYGKCINVYKGSGHLTLKDKRKFACNFEAGQLIDGTVLLLCASGPTSYFPFAFQNGVKFEGETTLGMRIHIRGRSWDTNFLAEPTGPGSWIAFKADELVVTASTKRPSILRFGLTNFKFSGKSIKYAGYFHDSLLLRLIDGGNWYPVKLRTINDYRRTMLRVQTLKSIEVTCIAEAEVKRNGGITNVGKVIDGLCRVASVARGTKIQWVYCDRLAKNGELVARIHASRLTKPYCPLGVIDYQEDDDDTRLFIERAYPAFCKRREDYELDIGTIDSYLDAKSEPDYLETRGAKLAIALEGLKTVFLHRSTVSEFVISEKKFEDVSCAISSAIKEALKADTAISKTDRNVIADKNRLRGLNRRSFAFAIRNLFKEIGLKVDNREIELFVQCRNKLVHAGDFYCRSASPSERARCKPLKSPGEEYYFMVNFLDRVFLKLLNYSDDYVNIRKIILGKPAVEKVD